MEFSQRLQEAANTGKPLIIDGGFATSLESTGLRIDGPLWSGRVLTEAPKEVYELHKKFFMSGADIVLTCTYQVTEKVIADHNLPYDADNLIGMAARLAIKAREEFSDRKLLVGGSVGPYGAALLDGSEYRGEYQISPTLYFDFHTPRIVKLRDCNVDFIAAETIPRKDEALSLAKICTELKIPVWISFCCRSDREIASGESLREIVVELDPYPAVAAIGVNCVAPELVSSLIDTIKTATSKPVVVYPNSGAVYDPVQKCWSPHSPQPLAKFAPEWITKKVSAVGGCCNCGPDIIATLANLKHPV